MDLHTPFMCSPAMPRGGCYNTKQLHGSSCMARYSSFVIGHLSFVLGWSLVIGQWSLAAEVANPLSPDEAQKAFQLADSSLRMELAAAEPEVVDPVAVRFDEDGRMWVVEMRDYPLGNPV